MSVKAVGPVDPVPVYLVPPYGQPFRIWHLVNLDPATTVFYDDTPTITTRSNQLPPLGSATFDGSNEVWCSTAGGAAALVQTGIRGQRGWSAGPVLAAQQIQQFGVPPVVTGAKSASVLGQNAQVPTTFFTFTAAGHIWAAHLTYAVGTNSTYSSAVTQFYSRVKTGSGLDLCVVELAVSAANQNTNGGDDLSMPGIAVAQGDTLKLDVNNGNSVPGSGGAMRASAIVIYSIP